MSFSYAVGKSIAKYQSIWLLGAGVVLIGLYSLAPSPAPQQAKAIAAATAAAPPKIFESMAQICADSMPSRFEEATQALRSGQPKSAFDALDICRDHLTPAAQVLYQKSMADIPKFEAAQQKKAAVEAKKQESIQRAAKRKEGVSVGMSAQDALDSSWGKPRKINRTIHADFVQEQWVYGGSYLYFENGVLTSIQN